jgi:hypothetical protein
MKPSTPFKSTTQVPDPVLFALTKRRILNTEARVILAICALSEKTPGKAVISYRQLAEALGTTPDRAIDLASGCLARNLIQVQHTSTGMKTLTPHVFRVNSPSTWNVPG